MRKEWEGEVRVYYSFEKLEWQKRVYGTGAGR